MAKGTLFYPLLVFLIHQCLCSPDAEPDVTHCNNEDCDILDDETLFLIQNGLRLETKAVNEAASMKEAITKDSTSLQVSNSSQVVEKVSVASKLIKTVVRADADPEAITGDSNSKNLTMLADSESSQVVAKISSASKDIKTSVRADGDSLPNKLVVTLLEAFGLGMLGIDRIYLGCYEANHLNIWLGIVKLLTLGGCGIWAIVDWFAIIINGMSKSESIAFGGAMDFTWEPSSVQGAYVVSLISVILVAVSCGCTCCMMCCTSSAIGAGAMSADKGSSTGGGFKP